MNESEIIELFNAAIAERSAVKVFGITKDQVNSYRNKKQPSLGIMLELLMKAGLITIQKNESKG